LDLDLSTPESALRHAAALGPGYRGSRAESDEATRNAVVAALTEFGIEPPPYLAHNTAWVERRAKLFEAGEYPDKGITVTRDHLSRLSQAFDLPVPVLIEHAHSPLELGYLTQVETVGEELFGTIALSAEANQLLERQGARSLSLGLEPDLSAIREVSLVRRPRVASAKLFRFHATLAGAGDYWRSQYEALAQRTRDEAAERQVRKYIREGRLTPAQSEFAKAILLADGALEFGGERRTVAHLFAAMMESLPARKRFAEQAEEPAGDYSRHLLLPEEAEFYRRHFPDVDLDQIALRKG